MGNRKVQPLLAMPLRENGPFLLDYRLHSMLFEVTTSGLGRERLVDYVFESLGDLDSILNLTSTDQALAIENIGERKLRRPTTRGLGKIGMMFSAKSGYGTSVDTSRR
jgi:hypothetical protein